MVAPDAAEIDVVPASLAEARQALGSVAPALEAGGGAVQAEVLAAHAPGHLRPRELWPVAALVLFLLLVLESLLTARRSISSP